MKTAELEGAALDAAVALVEGKTFERATARTAFGCDVGAPIIGFERDGPIVFRPSTNWSIGGPIVQRERIAIVHEHGTWLAYVDGDLSGPDGQLESLAPGQPGRGPTPLIAAMRAFVASKLGEEGDSP